MRTNSTILDPAIKHVDDQATALTRDRYQRISPFYDRIEGLMERQFRPWRQKLWQFVYGPWVLEVGVGTGKNIEFWPLNCKITAVDLTPGMLDIARQRANSLNRQDNDLFLADVQHLEFPSAIFNTVVATFVFCSVPDPIQGLRELGRVVRPNGQILLLEHVRIDRPIVGTLMDLLLRSLFDWMEPASTAGQWRMCAWLGCRSSGSSTWTTWACSSLSWPGQDHNIGLSTRSIVWNKSKNK
ncbi:MAG TPA: methyltransferase domain-containing protein [Anaerolineales bacterium]